MEKAICVVCLLLLLLWDWGSYIKDPILLFSLVGEKRVGVPNASSTVAKLTTSGLGSGLVGGLICKLPTTAMTTTTTTALKVNFFSDMI